MYYKYSYFDKCIHSFIFTDLPTVTCDPEVWVDTNQSVDIACDVTSPGSTHTVTWLTRGSDSLVNETGLNLVFRIDEAKPSDSGVYVCETQSLLIDYTGSSYTRSDNCTTILFVQGEIDMQY